MKQPTPQTTPAAIEREVIHDQLQKLAQKVWDEHGILIRSAHFQWRETETFHLSQEHQRCLANLASVTVDSTFPTPSHTAGNATP